MGLGIMLLAGLCLIGLQACSGRRPAGKPTGPLAASGSLPGVAAGPRQSTFPLLPGGYRRVVNADIRNDIAERYGGVTLTECATLCTEAEFGCRSFDYYARLRICDLSERTAGEIGSPRPDPYGPVHDHYERLVSAP